jgi:hypothetical protein
MRSAARLRHLPRPLRPRLLPHPRRPRFGCPAANGACNTRNHDTGTSRRGTRTNNGRDAGTYAG